MSAMTFGVFSSNGSAIGVLICDHRTVSSTLTARLRPPRTFLAGDELIFAQGALTIMLS
jgi:hypothetical protein